MLPDMSHVTAKIRYHPPFFLKSIRLPWWPEVWPIEILNVVLLPVTNTGGFGRRQLADKSYQLPSVEKITPLPSYTAYNY
jgi:hypothetical protein